MLPFRDKKYEREYMREYRQRKAEEKKQAAKDLTKTSSLIQEADAGELPQQGATVDLFAENMVRALQKHRETREKSKEFLEVARRK